MLDPTRLRVGLAAAMLFGCSASNERDHRAQDTSLSANQAMEDTLSGTQDSAKGALGKEKRVAQDTGLAAPLHFKPAAGESVAVVHALKIAMQRPNAPQMLRGEIHGQIFRLDSTPGKRYLLFAGQPRYKAADGEHWGRSFYVLDLSNGGIALSPPLDMKDAEYITVETIRDVNGDGAVDVVYCKGYEGEEEAPRQLAATYRGGRWIALPDSLVTRGTCKGTPY
jgi:hypothetical protein